MKTIKELKEMITALENFKNEVIIDEDWTNFEDLRYEWEELTDAEQTLLLKRINNI